MSEKKELRVFSDKEPSEAFVDAFSSGCGGIVRDCTCGRVTFNYDDKGCYEEGELEGLMKKAQADPVKYIGVDYTVGTMIIEECEWVIGCPCNRGHFIERFLIRDDRKIAQYLRARMEQLNKHVKALEL